MMTMFILVYVCTSAGSPTVHVDLNVNVYYLFWRVITEALVQQSSTSGLSV